MKKLALACFFSGLGLASFAQTQQTAPVKKETKELPTCPAHPVQKGTLVKKPILKNKVYRKELAAPANLSK